MQMLSWRALVLNCFWLVLPVLVFNIVFAKALPADFQPATFWRDIPPLIAIPENLFRIAMMVLMVAMPLPVGQWRGKRWGLWSYALGIAIYAGSWAALILWPDSGWSRSLPGFMAPAVTPLLWLAGIGLLADWERGPFHPFVKWAYVLCGLLFLVGHWAHTLTVWLRV